MDSSIQQKIQDFKKNTNTIILGHNYQLPEIQDISDFVGDSLDLAKKATNIDAENIIFCGVTFMAESAKILNQDKNVIIPDKNAQCPMAHMVKAKELIKLKEKYPEAEVVSYINTTAEIKCLSDICCTSSNGIDIVRNTKSKKVIFVPDRNLGSYIQANVKNKELILWPGFCSTHNNIRKKEIVNLKESYPRAEVLVHPECKPEIIDIADQVLSTNGMVNYSRKSDKMEFIIGTEKELCYRLRKEIPNKLFYPIKTAICPNMKKITLEKVLNSLETLEPKIQLSKKILDEAIIPLQKMMDIGRRD